MDTYVGLEPQPPFLLSKIGTGVTMPAQPSSMQFSRVPTGGTDAGTWGEIDIPPHVDDWLGLRGSGIEKFWFELLWIVPLVVDVGIISEETSVPVYKYNSKRHEPMLITAISNLVDPDISLSGLAPTPYFIPTQTRMVFFVVVSEEGNLNFDGPFLFITPTGQYRLYVVGQRAVIWNPPPPEDNFPPQAIFYVDIDNVVASFTDASRDPDGEVVAWYWTFGDGAESAEQNPTHTYVNEGTFTVTLTVTDNQGATGTASARIFIRLPENFPPVSAFSVTSYGLDATYTDLSRDDDGEVVAWLWTFGDGAESAEQNPTHTYVNEGTFTVTLTVTDNRGDTGWAWAQITITEGVGGGQTGQTPSDKIGIFPRGVRGELNEAPWTLEGPDELLETGSGFKIFEGMAEGEYTVTWGEWGEYGYTPAPQTKTKGPPFLGFSGYYIKGSVKLRPARASDNQYMPQVRHRLEGPYGLVEEYAGHHQSTYPDGYVYGSCVPGIYKVTWLPLENWIMPETVTEEKELEWDGQVLFEAVYTWVPPEPDPADPEPDPEPVCNFIWTVNGLTVVFLDASYDPLGEIVSWAWDLGDGTETGTRNPTHTYEDGGLYAVTLTVVNDEDFSDSVTHNVRVRVPPPPLRPSPSDEIEQLTPETPIVEVLEWKTDIVANVYGEEQRIGVRRFPRQFLRYGYLARSSHARRSLVSLLHGWQGKNYLLPVWPDAHYPTQPIVATSPDQDIFVDTSWGGFRKGTMVLITDGYNSDAALILEIHSGRLATTPLVRDYATSALVMPCRTARLTDSQGVKRYPEDLEEFDLLFQVITNDTGLFGYGTAVPLFNGRPVLDDPNMLMSSTLDEGVFTKQQVLDTGVGVPWIWSFWEQSRVATKKTWHCRTRKETWEIRRFLYYLHGSRRTFYVPTFYPDLSVQETITDGGTHMDIMPINYHRYLRGEEPLKAIQVLLWNGARLNFLVTDSEAVTVGGNRYERLHLDPVSPYEIKPEDIRMVSFMRLCRIADDVAKITYHSTGESTVEVNLIGVQG